MADRVGITSENVMFTSNDTPPQEFRKARLMGAIINLDDIGHIPYLEKAAGIPDLICFRYNGKLACAELLLRPNGKVQQIRRAETIEDYFATLDFS